ncbi:mucin-13 [Anomaloglossus baeobatrachus]|uniref:mucin-13 n=1 Tax=Anomaloglossus baeobatrachus TaxID=238106 RepID=UPI003F504F5C
MRGAAILTVILLLTTGHKVNAASTAAPSTESPDAPSTEAPNTGSPDTASTEAPDTGSPDTASTEAPNTGSPDTAVTEDTGSPDTASTEAPDTGSPDTASTEAPDTGSPDTASTEAPDTGSPQTVQTNDPNVTTTKMEPVTTMAGGLTTSKPKICSPAACVNGSTCIQLHNTYECRCPLNYHYNPEEKSCSGGESFYGELTITGQTFKPEPQTPEYTAIHEKVTKECSNKLSHLPSYLGSVVLEMREVSSKSPTRHRRSPGDVIIKVSNMFTPGAVTAANVTEAFKSLSGSFTAYKGRSICDGFYCDAETTNCEATPDDQSASCSCKEGKFSSSAVPEVTSCRDCDPTCYEAEGAYCNLRSKTGASCACMAGYTKSGNKCQKCDFGYSGENCSDNFLLILVIVGAVLGAAVVALLGAVIGVTVSSKKETKYSDRTTLIKEETPMAGGSPAPARLFPKVQAKTDLGEVNKGANVFDDYEEYSRNFPKRDYEENPWYEMAKKDRNY